MTYVVTEACIRCKYMDCVEVCPVDCFYEGENMLVIHPDECIDCGVCEPECPVEAIIPDSEPPAERWLELNRQYAASWPNIARKKPFPEDADDFKGSPTSSTNTSAPIPANAEGGIALPRPGAFVDLRRGYAPTGWHEARFHGNVIVVLLPVDHAYRAPHRVAGVTVAQSSDQLKRPGSAKWVDCERRI